MAALPEYACAVIEDARGWLLLQLRPSAARLAPDQLTCFGGRRESDEDDRACLDRELAEELGWVPTTVGPCCELWCGNRFIARFFHTTWNGRRLSIESGHLAIWVPWSALTAVPISPWHARVLAEVGAGGTMVRLPQAETEP